MGDGRARKGLIAPIVARTREMALFRTGKPNVKALARRGDIDGLVAAACFQDLIRGTNGRMVDRGATVRQEAILARGSLRPDAGTEAVKAALLDPSDGVRVAAIRALYAREDSLAIAAASSGCLPTAGTHGRLPSEPSPNCATLSAPRRSPPRWCMRRTTTLWRRTRRPYSRC
jgi:hypothetical protein